MKYRIKYKKQKGSGNTKSLCSPSLSAFYTVLDSSPGIKPLCYSSVSSSMMAVEGPASCFSGSSLLSS